MQSESDVHPVITVSLAKKHWCRQNSKFYMRFSAVTQHDISCYDDRYLILIFHFDKNSHIMKNVHHKIFIQFTSIQSKVIDFETIDEFLNLWTHTNCTQCKFLISFSIKIQSAFDIFWFDHQLCITFNLTGKKYVISEFLCDRWHACFVKQLSVIKFSRLYLQWHSNFW